MKNEIISELHKINPSLSEEKMTLPYQVPEGYFNNLSDRILANIQKSKPTLFRRLISSPPSWSIAASILILLGSWYVFNISNSSDIHISSEDALVYIENNFDEFDEFSFVDLTSFDEFAFTPGLDFPEEMLDQIIDELNENDLEELF
jgi:hypothetical protein